MSTDSPLSLIFVEQYCCLAERSSGSYSLISSKHTSCVHNCVRTCAW